MSGTNITPSHVEIDRLLALSNERSYAEAEIHAHALLELYPDSGFIWKILSLSLHMQGKDPHLALQKAAHLLPEDAGVYNNLGNVLHARGQLKDAVASYRHALKLKPNSAMLHNNLGIILRTLGQHEAALVSCRHAVEIDPAYADAYNNLGASQHDLGQLDDAEGSYRHALEIQPDFVEALNNLGNLLLVRGQPLEALNFAVQALRIEGGQESKRLFISCITRAQVLQVDGFVRDFMISALSEPWCRPLDIVQATIQLLKLNPNINRCMSRAIAAWPRRLSSQELYGAAGVKVVSEDRLLRCLLESAPAWGLEMERFLTSARHILLFAFSGGETDGCEDEETLGFYSALAQQCFINEFVFAWTTSEAEQAHKLRELLVAALQSGTQISVLLPLIVASYFPLNTIPLASRLLEMAWPDVVNVLLTQQIREPLAEQQYRATMDRLTEIDDEVSLLVKNQYEENPYPRWIKAEPVDNPGTIDQMFARDFPLAPLRPLGDIGSADILIAGCGTGQHPISVAQKYTGARVLAIDLSLASLGYAKRKAQELGLTQIEFAQADITKLRSLERNFNVIESVGVLHHLADPLEGWRVLLSLLRPKGVMKIGLYSEVARQAGVSLRASIKEHGYGSVSDDIRRFRQDLMDVDKGENFGSVLKSADFFTTSACRDLLFHVQEHLMTIAGIETFLRENDLHFLGFEHRSDVFHAYSQRFPEDQAATSLKNWRIFENENPDTFSGMYQFWVQKAD